MQPQSHITTTERELQLALDQNPGEQTIRFALADYLDEIGDIRAAGYRELARLDREPYKSTSGYWWPVCILPLAPECFNSTEFNKAILTDDWVNKICTVLQFTVYSYWDQLLGTRELAENFAARCYYQLKNPTL